ncbi:MAG: hypothetical protein ACERKK_09285 [Poseidonibacter sp.]|uniref:hypothetical protein n=1 Tax=Poseidonibacter sp. TaxID=2321188 RepID=UPI00359E6ABC
MKLFKAILVSFLLLIFITGCAQKTQIRAIKAAQVTDKAIKNIGVLPFKSDYIAQSSQIDSTIANVKINDKNYFNLIDRNNISRIMEEKKLNDSGLVKLIKGNRTEGLAQIETLVTGKVNVSDVATSNYLEGRTDYDTCVRTAYTKKGDAYCAKYRTYNVKCKANTYSVNTKVKLIKVSNSKTIFTKNYSASNKIKKCIDQNIVLPTKRDQNTKLAGYIATQLVKDIAPSYVYFTAELMDEPDIDYTDIQKGLLKTSLVLIENKRLEKAEKLLKKLNKLTNFKSYVALYNYGIVNEALGNVEEALNLFKKAEDISLMTKVEENIAIAIIRAEKNLIELQKSKKQL